MKFKFEGFRQGGTTQRGEVEAGTKEQACEKLRLAGIYLQQIVPAGEQMKAVLPEGSLVGSGPSEPAFLDTSLGSAVDPSAVSDPAFVPPVVPIIVPTQAFTPVPREEIKVEPKVEPKIEQVIPRETPQPETVCGTLEPWQVEFKAKMEAFTLTMVELKKYIQDEEMLKDVAKTNLGYIVGQAWNNVLRPQHVDETLGETKESHAEKTKRKKK